MSNSASSDTHLTQNYMRICSSAGLSKGTCTGSEIFTKLDTKIKEMGLSWDNRVGVCTDGAGAMVGKYKGLKARF